MVLVVGAGPAAAQGALDANCPGPVEDFDTFGGDQRIAQTFPVQNGGRLVRGEIEIRDPSVAPDVDWVMQIVTTDGFGVPTNTVLASVAIPDSSVPNGESRLAATFAVPPSVEPGQQYAIVLTRPGSATNSFGIGEHTGNPCPGRPFESPSQNGAWALPSDPNEDLVFAVFVEPPPPPKADRTLTLDTNKSKVRKGKKVRFSGQLNASGNEAACEPGQTVELQRKKPSQSTYVTFEQVQTDAAGNFSTKEKVKKTFEYHAEVTESANCNAAASDTEKVKVRKKK